MLVRLVLRVVVATLVCSTHALSQQIGPQTPTRPKTLIGPDDSRGGRLTLKQAEERFLKENLELKMLRLEIPMAQADVDVVIHDGGTRLTDRRPELAWVRVTGGDSDVFLGRMLNRSHQPVTVPEDGEIQFVAPEGIKHRQMVTSKYLRDAANGSLARATIAA